MEIEELKRLGNELKAIENHFSKYPKDFNQYKNINKDASAYFYENKFNGDVNYIAARTHEVNFSSSKKSEFDSYNKMTILNIKFSALFWSLFDDYINENAEDIFKYIAKGYRTYFEKEYKKSKESMDNLTSLKEEIE